MSLSEKLNKIVEIRETRDISLDTILDAGPVYAENGMCEELDLFAYHYIVIFNQKDLSTGDPHLDTFLYFLVMKNPNKEKYQRVVEIAVMKFQIPSNILYLKYKEIPNFFNKAFLHFDFEKYYKRKTMFQPMRLGRKKIIRMKQKYVEISRGIISNDQAISEREANWISNYYENRETDDDTLKEYISIIFV